MKSRDKKPLILLALLWWMMGWMIPAWAQSETYVTEEGKSERIPVKNMFAGILLLDNQTAIVPIKGTLELDIQHRFGTIKEGYVNFFGLYAPSNIRIGLNFTPVDNLMVGAGFTKQNTYWDFDAKYALFKQSQGKGFPVSLTYFGNIGVDTRKKENFVHGTDRLSYFHQLIFARKVNDHFSVQVAPSLSHFNAVDSYLDENDDIVRKMKNNHLAISFSGRYKIRPVLALIASYDQPITKHFTNNPNPNLSFGLEVNTSSHAFQFFVGNYYNIVPQRNHMFNSNNYEDGEFLIGFNITRLWN